ncbi:MAG TPA: hypothetical protein VFI61_02900 [Patescibacteria group bacterium]|nr:hypothetical protein [Patescibacteria group bacterium]
MKIDRLPDSLLNGKFLHCKPVENGLVVEAKILPSGGELPMARVVIVCPFRMPRSKCELLVNAENNDDHCLYYKGDSRGGYQIIGPNMGEKTEDGYK